MRKKLFWLGWAVLFVLPVLFAIQIYIAQDLPRIELWKWSIPLVAVAMIFLSRERDDVLKHHVV